MAPGAQHDEPFAGARMRGIGAVPLLQVRRVRLAVAHDVQAIGGQDRPDKVPRVVMVEPFADELEPLVQGRVRDAARPLHYCSPCRLAGVIDREALAAVLVPEEVFASAEAEFRQPSEVCLVQAAELPEPGPPGRGGVRHRDTLPRMVVIYPGIRFGYPLLNRSSHAWLRRSGDGLAGEYPGDHQGKKY